MGRAERRGRTGAGECGIVRRLTECHAARTNASTLTCWPVRSGAWVSCMQRTLKARMPRRVQKRSRKAKRGGEALRKADGSGEAHATNAGS